ncbi:SdrD B-like domain-containing protein [Psychromonas hadalis]|uniref:SdrD B-like domain-containing protein n=1 Tax=Psychromonas hadalis TaxID=211669 RepID=UPI0003B4CFDD|nr:SdrD B-like domain-containing protein [Psychromonas hadalis]
MHYRVFLLLLITVPAYALDKLSLQTLLDNPALQATLERITTKTAKSDRPHDIEQEITGIASGEELLLSLYVKQYYLSDLYAYKNANNAQIGLDSLFQLLDFAINVDLESKSATGWFISEDKPFSLDWNDTNNILVNGKVASLTKAQYRIEYDDIYIDADILNHWFGLDFIFNFNDLKVEVKSDERLPIEQKIAREKQATYKNSNSKATLPWKPSSYQMLSTPLIDVQLNASTNKNGHYGSYSVLASHDLAYLNSQLFVSGNKSDSLSDLRLTLSKEDANGELLGLLGATEYQFGDITPVKTAIGDTGGIGRGFLISNKKLNNIDNNRSTTFSGNIQPGWDIELYRNGLLIDKQLTVSNGRYDFKDVDLLFGDNQFELIFYGPQGQVRSENYQYYIDGNALKAKQSEYAFSTVEVEETLFGISSVTKRNQPGWLSTLTYDQGITDWLSLNGGVEALSATLGEDTYTYSVGSNLTILKQLLLSADFQQDDGKHQKSSYTARTQIAQHAFNFTYEWQDHFKWQIPDEINTRQEMTFSMVGNILKNSFLPINYQNYWRQTQYNQANQTDEFSNQIAFYTPLASVTHKISLFDYDTEQATQNIKGFLRLQRSFGSVYTRLQGSYELQPESKLTQVRGELSYPFTEYLQSELSVDYYPLNQHYRTQLGLNWLSDKFSINSTLSYDDSGLWSAGIFTRFSFGYDPMTESYLISQRSIANNGALMVRVYEDKNLNQQFDEGEPLLEGVKIKGVQSRQRAETDQYGIATLYGQSGSKASDIILDKESIEDPFLIPSNEGFSITARKGYINVLEFSLVTASELEGTVYLKNKAGELKTIPYIKVLLHNQAGELIKTTETEFDGYYLFTELLPGEYNASLEIAYSKKKKLKQAENITVSLQGNVINGADFTLIELEFIKGYSATLGSFHSLSMLKTYWQLLKNSYSNALNQQVFYMQNKQTHLYDLHGAFFKQKQQAVEACLYLDLKKINCEVNNFEFDITSD